MTITIGQNEKLTFKRSVDFYPDWVTTYLKGKMEIEFSFEERIFPSRKEMDWEGIEFCMNKVIPQIETLIRKSHPVLIALHKEIFGNEFEEHDCYFDFIAVEITSVKRDPSLGKYIDFAFDLIFSLESDITPWLDNNFSYYSSFFSTTPHLLTLVGVSRR